MKRSIEFLNRAMETYSGYQICKLLGLSGTGAVSNWKKREHISPYYAAKLAELIGEDPREAIAIAGAEAEPDAEKRSYLLKKLAGVAAGVIVSVNLFFTPTPSKAAPMLPLKSSQFALRKTRRKKKASSTLLKSRIVAALQTAFTTRHASPAAT